MAVEKQAQPTPVQIDAMRLDAVRTRVLAQEWAGTAMRDLTKAVTRLHTQPPQTTTRAEYTALAEPILSLCDQLAVAAEVAAASIHVAGNERFELASHMADIEAEVAREEIEVERLRKVLERERRQVERRAQYDAVAKVILAEPEPSVSQSRLDEARKELDQVGQEIAKIQAAKDAMSKELALFLHCASNLDAFSAQFGTLLEEEEKGAMDTSS